MTAADVMVSKVITVGPNARVEEVAKILLTNRAEAGTERRRSWWLEYFTSKQILAKEYVKSHSRTVADIMTQAALPTLR